jgi:hypothetical protein
MVRLSEVAASEDVVTVAGMPYVKPAQRLRPRSTGEYLFCLATGVHGNASCCTTQPFIYLLPYTLFPNRQVDAHIPVDVAYVMHVRASYLLPRRCKDVATTTDTTAFRPNRVVSCDRECALASSSTHTFTQSHTTHISLYVITCKYALAKNNSVFEEA